MKNIFLSNDTLQLSLELAKVLKSRSVSPFIPDRYIVPHAGMESWLKFRISEQNGIFSNFLFLGMDDMLADLWHLSGGKGYPASHLHLKFTLFNLLNESSFKTDFSEIAVYYEGNECRRLQLAGKVATVFDQYQVYRSDMIAQWDRSSEIPLSEMNSEEERWQFRLWKRLRQEKELRLNVDIRLGVLEAMEDVDFQSYLKALYPRLIFFAQSHFPDFYWEIIRKLDSITDVDLYMLLPTPSQSEYKHPLLVDWGRQARELRNRLLPEDFASGSLFMEPDAESSLHNAVRHQIFHNVLPVGNCFTADRNTDGSIEINSCYTRVREVEILYNYLMDRFDKDPGLQPEDILVVAPDIDLYAPFIDGIFKNAPKIIPYHIAGSVLSTDSSVLATLREILEFRKDDFTSEKVMSLLEKKRIRDCFGIVDTEYLRAQVNAANIRFGWENQTGNETVYVGWKYNLDRFILGYAMLTESEFSLSDELTAYPFSDAESSSSYDLFRLHDFATKLHDHLEARETKRTLPHWITFLFENVADRMIATSYSDKEELGILHRRLSLLECNTELYADEITFDVFLEVIESFLFTEMHVTPFRTGTLRFTSASLARGIPADIIAFLGLNQSDFPRKDHFAGFDLTGFDYQPGDRRIRESDKSLFLDLFMNARIAFYGSYIGQDATDNTELPGSILIDELLGFLQSHTSLSKKEKEGVLCKHPLHGFSNRYQTDAKRLFTYLYGGMEPKLFLPSPEVPPDIPSVDINALIRFFDSPLEWFYKKVLEINFDENDDTLQEVELFDLDNLQEWYLKNKILNSEKDREDTERFRLRRVKEGTLPLGSLGRYSLQKACEVTDPLKKERDLAIRGRERRPVMLDLKFSTPEVRLTGTIEDVYDRDFIHVSLSDLDKSKYKMRFLIRHMALSMAQEISCSIGICLTQKGVVVKEKSQDLNPEEGLSILLNIFLEGNRELLPFHPRGKEKEQKIFDLNEWRKRIEEQFVAGNNNCSLYGAHLLEGEFPLTEEKMMQVNAIIDLFQLDDKI